MKSHQMKNWAIALAISTFVLGCNRGTGLEGQLTGSLDRSPWSHLMPYGMIYIPSGTLHIGPSDQDINRALVQRAKSISIQGFYMDDTEISNNEYRQFVEWVRDSIAHRMLGGEHLLDEGEPNERINWDMPIDYESPDNEEALAELYFAENERFWGRKEINPGKLNYAYMWVD